MRYLMHMACPQCFLEGRANREYWIHGGSCGGYLYVDDSGYVRCDKCGKSAKVTKMRFTCDCGRHRYSISSKKGWGGAVCASDISNKSDALSWFQTFLKHL